MKNTHIVALAIVMALLLGGAAIVLVMYVRDPGHNMAAPSDGMDPGAGGPAGGRPTARETKFDALDTDRDGKLTLAEFSAGRKPGEAAKWFERRDANKDGFISRDEFLPFSATPKGQ
jgi:hypothetical protein